jgi:hypothetical protein
MTTSPDSACTSCSTKTCVLRVITWTLLIVTIVLWMVNIMAATAALASLTFTLGMIAACIFLLFFAAQLMG